MPDLTIVSQNSEADIQRSATEDRVEAAALALATNILRIVRGAGKPERLIDHTLDYVKCAQAFYEAHGRWPVPELHQCLGIDRVFSVEETRKREWCRGEDLMVRGALQVAASRLAGQRTQESAGRSEMFDGLYIIERQREENRKAVRQHSVKPKLRRRT